MKNYSAKIPLGNGKYAYEQDQVYREKGEAHVSLIKKRWEPPTNYFHLRSGGHVEALKRHIQCNFFSKIDLKRFYYHVTKNKILRSLKKIGFSFDDADQISRESVVLTEQGFALPYGFVQSPILSSVAFQHSVLGKFVQEISTSFIVSVYVDDIIISHEDDQKALNSITEQLISTAMEAHFPANNEKCEIAVKQITSFNIEMCRNSLVITDARMNDFYVALHSQPSKAQVTGILNYVAQVNEAQCHELEKSCRSIGLL